MLCHTSVCHVNIISILRNLHEQATALEALYQMQLYQTDAKFYSLVCKECSIADPAFVVIMQVASCFKSSAAYCRAYTKKTRLGKYTVNSM
jgi:hypothetical protein